MGGATPGPHSPGAKIGNCLMQFVMLAAVRVLYGVLLLSTVAIVWVAVAVARHIVQHRRAMRARPEQHDDPV